MQGIFRKPRVEYVLFQGWVEWGGEWELLSSWVMMVTQESVYDFSLWKDKNFPGWDT